MKINIFIKIFLTILVLTLAYFFLNERFGKQHYSNNSLNREEVQESNKDAKNSELNLLFVGDVMLDRFIRKKINESSKVEDFVNNFLTNLRIENKKYDYVVANLEGPITESRSKTLNDDGTFGKELIFTFPSSTVEILQLLNIKVVSLANNHTDNFYYEGFQSTINFLEKGKIDYFGNPYNSSKDGLSKIVCENNICIGYIAYNQFTGENGSEIIVNEIKKLKEDKNIDFVVVFPHWGEEYELKANSTQINYAHKWIDAGADLIIGAHPHVIQNNEIYKEKFIYYSLGNYIFDQWFEEAVKNGLAVNFKFKKDENDVRSIEFIKEIKVRNEKTGIKYILD